MEVCGRPDETQNGAQMASACLSQMVAVEISTERRPSNYQPGNAWVDPTFESRECPVERRNHPWTFGATRFRSTLPRHHQEVYGQAFGRNGQVPRLVDLPAKSPASVMGHGLLHGSYSALSNPLHLCDLESFPSPGRALCCDGASHDDLGGPATAGSDAFWSTTQLSVPRQRRSLRRRGEPVCRGNWDCRSQNGSPVPLAKSIRGKVWRYATARVVGSRDGH